MLDFCVGEITGEMRYIFPALNELMVQMSQQELL